MKERFEGNAGRRLLIDALKTQKMIAGNAALAEELAGLVEVIEVQAGETIIRQGASESEHDVSAQTCYRGRHERTLYCSGWSQER